MSQIIGDSSSQQSTLKYFCKKCIIQFMFNYTFCDYFKDLSGKYIKGKDDVSRLFLLQLLGTQIGLNLVGQWNNLDKVDNILMKQILFNLDIFAEYS